MPAITNAQLQSLPEDVLRATLVALCNNDAQLRARVTKVVRVAASVGKKKPKADDAADDQGIPDTRRQKRKANNATDDQELPEARRQKLDGLAICIDCKKPYLQSENVAYVCWYHPEEAELDEDSHIWEQWQRKYARFDDDPWDTEENREKFPQGFVHGCCDEELYESSGCTWGLHTCWEG